MGLASSPSLMDDTFKSEASRLRRLISEIPIFAGTLSPAGIVTDYNFTPLDGGRPPSDSVIGKPMHECHWWNYDQASMDQMEGFVRRAAAGETIVAERPYCRHDGKMAVVEFRAKPLYHNGELIEILCTGLDVTERVRNQEQKELLLRELNHRVKNTLATIYAIAELSLRDDRPIADGRKAFLGRIEALSTSHDVLTNKDWAGASVGEIVAEALKPFGGTKNHRFVIQGGEVWIRPEPALALALAINELATNALKHGALSNDRGQVLVSWDIDEVDGECKVHFVWRETGGPEVKPPKHKGFGTVLLEHTLGLDTDGGCKIHYDPPGVRFECHLPGEIKVADS